MRKDYLYILLLAFTLTSCERVEEEDTLIEQVERIESYLDSEGLDYTVRDDIYSVYLNEEENMSQVIIADGDSVYINYAGFVFESGISDLYTTNIQEIAIQNDVVFEGDFKPLGLKYGESDILQGLNIGLRGLLEGDSVMLYVPSDFAYKEKEIGILPQYTTIAMFVEVFKIVKN